MALLYLLTLSGNHSETEDSLVYAVRIRDEPHTNFFEGPHLIFDWVGWAVYELVRGLGLTDDTLRPIQAFDALLGAATIGLLWIVVRRAGLGRSSAFVACGLLACSYGFWRNGVEVEVYTLSAFMLVASLGAALRAVATPSAGAFAVLGLVNGAAVLAHATNVLFSFVALGALFLARRERDGRIMPWFGAYAGAASASVVGAYAVAAAVVGLGSPQAFWSWLTMEDVGSEYGMASATDAVIGCGRALIGAHFILAIHAVRTFVRERFPSRPLREETFFLRGTSSSLAIALSLGAMLTVILVLVLASGWLRRPRLSPSVAKLAILCSIWIVPYGLLFAIWDPLNIELWYVFWIPAAVLLAVPLEARGTGRLRIAVGSTAVVGLLTINLLGSQLPQRDNAKDYWRVRAAWYRAHASGEDLVIAYDYVWSGYLAYLTRARIVDAQSLYKREPREVVAAELLRTAEVSRARHVFVSDAAFDFYRGYPAGCLDGRGTCANDAATRRALRPRSRLVARTPLERVWEYERRRAAPVTARGSGAP